MFSERRIRATMMGKCISRANNDSTEWTDGLGEEKTESNELENRPNDYFLNKDAINGMGWERDRHKNKMKWDENAYSTAAHKILVLLAFVTWKVYFISPPQPRALFPLSSLVFFSLPLLPPFFWSRIYFPVKYRLHFYNRHSCIEHFCEQMKSELELFFSFVLTSVVYLNNVFFLCVSLLLDLLPFSFVFRLLSMSTSFSNSLALLVILCRNNIVERIGKQQAVMFVQNVKCCSEL